MEDIKILFYTCTPRAFRTTLVGYLFEMSQKFSITLFSEKLDEETEKIIHDKNLFPKLDKIIQIDQFTGSKIDLFLRHRHLYKLAKDVLEEIRPDIIITTSDVNSLFELYLMKLGKKYNTLNIAIQPTIQVSPIKKYEKWTDYMNAYLRFPSFIPLKLRLFFVKIRKYIGHIIFYWLFPISLGKWPFFGKSSHILRRGNCGMRDSDHTILFSQREYDIWIEDGISPEKLIILQHPLETNTVNFFEKAYFANARKYVKEEKYITLVFPEMKIGFKEGDNSLICEKEKIEEWVKIIKIIINIFPDYFIIIKPHPELNDFEYIKKIFEELSDKILFIKPEEPIDKYIEIAEIIIGMPLSASTALFTAFLQNNNKKIISLNFSEEILGDCYKHFEGIEYIDNIEKFAITLNSIKNKNLNTVNKKEYKDNEIISLLIKLLNKKNDKQNIKKII